MNLKLYLIFSFDPHDKQIKCNVKKVKPKVMITTSHKEFLILFPKTLPGRTIVKDIKGPGSNMASLS